MIYEHEIPEGSRLYFGESARKKRTIEQVASEVLVEEGFDEIVTPFLSYHQHQAINEKELIRFSDHDNHIVSLRADSTLDVVRIVTRRLGRSTEQKQWFYIQPVFRYPSSEVYQIGGELIGDAKLSKSVNLLGGLLGKLECKPLLQISNIQIPQLISEILDLPLDVFKSSQLEKLLKIDEPWLTKLATLQRPEAIDEVIDVVPETLKAPLMEMKALAGECGYDHVVMAPLFYTKMRYYDQLFFRFIEGNKVLGSGGCYHFEGVESTGFGLYTDALIETLMK